MSDEMLLCPFCGSTAMIVDDWPHWDHSEPYGVGCSNEECVAYVGYGTRLFDTEAEAIYAWNRRADHD